MSNEELLKLMCGAMHFCPLHYRAEIFSNAPGHSILLLKGIESLDEAGTCVKFFESGSGRQNAESMSRLWQALPTSVGGLSGQEFWTTAKIGPYYYEFDGITYAGETKSELVLRVFVGIMGSLVPT